MWGQDDKRRAHDNFREAAAERSLSQGTIKAPGEITIGDKGDKGKGKKKVDKLTPTTKKVKDLRIKVVDKDVWGMWK